MKIVVLLCFVIAILEFTHSSPIEAEHVLAKIQAYALQRATMMVPGPGGPNTTLCFEAYIAQTTELAKRSATESEACIKNSDDQRVEVLAQAQKNRTVVDERVKGLQHSLNACTAEEDVSRYFICMKKEAPGNINALTIIKEDSSKYSHDLNQALEVVLSSERECIATVTAKAKQATNKVVNDFQKCLINGVVQH